MPSSAIIAANAAAGWVRVTSSSICAIARRLPQVEVTVCPQLRTSSRHERDDLEPPADAALAAAGPARLAGLRARRPPRGLPADDPARRRAPADARLPRRVDDRPGRRLPAARRHRDAAAA